MKQQSVKNLQKEDPLKSKKGDMFKADIAHN
jgi:hypothetical protein